MKRIKEGSAVLTVPKVAKPEEGEVFYNPEMAFDRNISVGVVSLLPVLMEKPLSKISGCDLLSATGVRAIRYCTEVGLKNVTANDWSKKAIALIKKNTKANGVRVAVANSEGNVLLRQERFDFIDIDPFGSPIGFVESAASSLPYGGFMAATATDTAPLCGTYPEVAERRYGIRSFTADYYAELGVRILLTAIMRKFFQHEKAFVPLLVYARKHYFRVYGHVFAGLKSVNRLMRNFDYVSHCFGCGWRSVGLFLSCDHCKKQTVRCGPIFVGELQNTEFCESLSHALWDRNHYTESTFVRNVCQELPFPLYYDIHALAHYAKVSAPAFDRVKELLEKEGFRVGRTHFSPTSVKTNAPFTEVLKAVKKV